MQTFREPYTFPYFEAISLVKTKRNRGSSPSTHGNNQNRNKFAAFEFYSRPFELAKFHQIWWNGR